MQEQNEERPEIVRGAQMEVAARLRSAGIDIADDTNPDALTSLLDAVETFEAAVRAAGGDLMVDEPPHGHEAQPDDQRFMLPKQRADETVESYGERIRAAARSIG
jgi:hypothetical protein